MRLLAFDTLGPSLTAVVADDGTLVAELSEPTGRGQAEQILPLLEMLLAKAGWVWTGLDLIAVTVGPGGFTAIRTGLAVARALALGLDRPILPVTSLEAMAMAAGIGPLLVVKDLRREQVAAQSFDQALVPAGDMALLGVPELPAMLAAASLVATDAGMVDLIGGDKPVVEVAPAARYVASIACRRVGRGERPVAGVEVRPCYLRGPDARLGAGRPLLAALAAT